MTKKKLLLICYLGVSLFILIILYNINSKSNEFTSSFSEFEKKSSEISGAINYTDYFEVALAEYKIAADDNMILYKLILRNITGKQLSYNLQVYKDQKLLDKYISGIEPAVMYNKDSVILETEKRAIYNMSSGFLYPYQSFSKEDKEYINSLANKLYIELCIDGKFDYFEVSLKQVSDFSDY